MTFKEFLILLERHCFKYTLKRSFALKKLLTTNHLKLTFKADTVGPLCTICFQPFFVIPFIILNSFFFHIAYLCQFLDFVFCLIDFSVFFVYTILLYGFLICLIISSVNPFLMVFFFSIILVILMHILAQFFFVRYPLVCSFSRNSIKILMIFVLSLERTQPFKQEICFIQGQGIFMYLFTYLLCLLKPVFFFNGF